MLSCFLLLLFLHGIEGENIYLTDKYSGEEILNIAPDGRKIYFTYLDTKNEPRISKIKVFSTDFPHHEEEIKFLTNESFYSPSVIKIDECHRLWILDEASGLAEKFSFGPTLYAYHLKYQKCIVKFQIPQKYSWSHFNNFVVEVKERCSNTHVFLSDAKYLQIMVYSFETNSEIVVPLMSSYSHVDNSLILLDVVVNGHRDAFGGIEGIAIVGDSLLCHPVGAKYLLSISTPVLKNTDLVQYSEVRTILAPSADILSFDLRNLMLLMGFGNKVSCQKVGKNFEISDEVEAVDVGVENKIVVDIKVEGSTLWILAREGNFYVLIKREIDDYHSCKIYNA